MLPPKKGPKKHVNMLDIAKAAGVSKSAVSKALNHRPDISEKTRKHIFRICEKMNYQINFRIQDMIKERKTGRTHNIAFVKIGSDFSDPAYSKAINGIARGVEEHNLRLLLEHLSGDEKNIYDLPPILRDGRVDGFLLTGQLTPGIVTVLEKLEIPFIVLGTYADTLIHDAITFRPDIRSGLEKIVSALKTNGYRKMAYFTEDPDNFFEKQMLSFFEQSLKEQKLPFQSQLVYTKNGIFSGAHSVMRPVFEQKELPFDSLICLNFRTALEISHLAYGHARQFSTPPPAMATARLFAGYTLPVPVVYYDNQFAEIAYQGMATLVKIIDGDRDVPQETLIAPDVSPLVPAAK